MTRTIAYSVVLTLLHGLFVVGHTAAQEGETTAAEEPVEAGGDVEPESTEEPAKVPEPVDCLAAPPNAEAIHDELRALKARMEKALNEQDLDALLENVTEDVVFTTMNSDVVTGREGVRAYFSKMLEGPEKIVEKVTAHFEVDALSKLHGGQVALAHGHTTDHYELADGLTFDVEARWSTTMVKQGDRWLVSNFHYSTNMFDNPVLAAAQQAGYLGAGVGSVILGLLGFFLGRRLSRRT